MSKFEGLNLAQLESKLTELKDLLEEVKEERLIILGQQNIHLPGKLVVKYEQELREIKEDIQTVEGLIREKSESI